MQLAGRDDIFAYLLLGRCQTIYSQLVWVVHLTQQAHRRYFLEVDSQYLHLLSVTRSSWFAIRWGGRCRQRALSFFPYFCLGWEYALCSIFIVSSFQDAIHRAIQKQGQYWSFSKMVIYPNTKKGSPIRRLLSRGTPLPLFFLLSFLTRLRWDRFIRAPVFVGSVSDMVRTSLRLKRISLGLNLFRIKAWELPLFEKDLLSRPWQFHCPRKLSVPRRVQGI